LRGQDPNQRRRHGRRLPVKPEDDRITRGKSLALIGSASARDGEVSPDGDAEALSITRLEGSRWRGGRLWSHKLGSPTGACAERTAAAAIAIAAAVPRGDRAAARGSVDGGNEPHAGDKADVDARVLAHITRAAVIPTRSVHHEVSKPSPALTSCRAVSMGPMTIGAPHRGQHHVAAVGGAFASGRVRRSRRRARVSRAVRQALAR